MARYCPGMMRGLLGLLLMGVTFLASCALRSEITLRSVENGATLRPAIILAAFVSSDASTADVFLTDLSRDDLDAGVDIRTITGQITHIRLFLVPRPGSTPIESTASTMTLRHAVLARGEMGVFAGGGFMDPDTDLGSGEFRSGVSGATLTLSGATPGFADRLGASRLSGTIVAPRDAALAHLIEQRLGDVLDAIGSTRQRR